MVQLHSRSRKNVAQEVQKCEILGEDLSKVPLGGKPGLRLIPDGRLYARNLCRTNEAVETLGCMKPNGLIVLRAPDGVIFGKLTEEVCTVLKQGSKF